MGKTLAIIAVLAAAAGGGFYLYRRSQTPSTADTSGGLSAPEQAVASQVGAPRGAGIGASKGPSAEGLERARIWGASVVNNAGFAKGKQATGSGGGFSAGNAGAGAGSGAAAGAAIGAPIGGIGAAPGAVVGGVVGFLAGGFF